jgi:hypothetical protein
MKQEQSSLGRRFCTASLVLAIITACANGGDADIADGGLNDVSTTKKDVGTQNDTGMQGQDQASTCSTCNIDLDCQNTCGAPPDQMTWCCDTSSSSCYPSPQCSSGENDAGGPG